MIPKDLIPGELHGDLKDLSHDYILKLHEDNMVKHTPKKAVEIVESDKAIDDKKEGGKLNTTERPNLQSRQWNKVFQLSPKNSLYIIYRNWF